MFHVMEKALLLAVICSVECQQLDDGGDPGAPLFLTPYINDNNIIRARELATVTHSQMNATESYAGYLTVNQTSNLFFWYFPAKIEPETAPVVMWLQGGPGSSSLFGLFIENGPFFVTDELTLEEREYSWHINHHLIYIDNPVGTGFSFADDDDQYARNERDIGDNLYEALKQFFTLFSELQSHPLFLSGESYAGKFIPALGHKIFTQSQIETEIPIINLTGMSIGNGLSDPIHQFDYADYLYQLGLVDEDGKQQLLSLQTKGIDCIKQKDFECAFDVYDQLLNLDQVPYGSLLKNLTGFDLYYNYIDPEWNSDTYSMMQFLQSSATRKAIHVGNNPFHDLEPVNKVEQYLKKDMMKSVAKWLSELLAHYKLLIYNGQLDMIVGYTLTESYLQNLKFSGDSEYSAAKRIIWRVDDEIAGYVKQGGNLTSVMVRNAGHLVEADQPKWALDMLLHMTMNKLF